MTTSRLTIFVLGIITLLVWPSPPRARGAVLYVSATDPGCGGQAPCYSRISAAVRAAGAGDRVVVQAGVYPSFLIEAKNGFAGAVEGDRVVVEADPEAPPGGVVVRGDAGCDPAVVTVRASRFVTIRGFTITRGGGPGIALAGGLDGNAAIRLERNRVYDNGGAECRGAITIEAGNPDSVIAANLVYANGGHGLAFHGASGGPHYVVGNTIHANGRDGVNAQREHLVFLVDNAITDNGREGGVAGTGIRREASARASPVRATLLGNVICGNRLGEIAGPVLDASDDGNLTPTGGEGPGVSSSPGCELAPSVYGGLLGADAAAGTADDDFTPHEASPLLDVGVDPRGLGFGAALDPVFEVDVFGQARPVAGAHGRLARFDAGAVEYRPPNAPPVAHAGASRTVVEGTVFNLDATASRDPNGDPLTLEWSQTGGPVAVIVGATTATPVVTAPTVTDPATLTFQLRVSDGRDDDVASVTITVVRANLPPILDPLEDRTVQAGEALTVVLSAADADGDALSFTVTPEVANATLDPTDGVFGFTPDATQVGTVVLTFGAHDGRGGSALQSMVLTVTAGLRVDVVVPAAGSVVPSGVLVVRGSVVGGGADLGVSVNGVPAAISGADFAATVAVDVGVTALSVQAVAGAAAATSVSVPITVEPAALARMTMSASPASGPPPLTVALSVAGAPAGASFEVDVEGDGVVDDVLGRGAWPRPYAYAASGVYVPVVTVVAPDGARTALSAVVHVVDPVGVDGVLQARWNAFRDALARADVDGALRVVAQASREPFGSQLAALAGAGGLARVANDLGPIAAVDFRQGAALYDLRVVRDGRLLSYVVLFVVDTDGTWKLWAF